MLARIGHHLPALLSILVRGLGVLAGFGITLLIGREWGPEANGVYALVTQTAIFLSILVVGGLDLGITRFFAAALGRGNRVGWTSLTHTLGITLVPAAALILALQLAGGWLQRLPLFGQLPQGVLPVLFVMLAARALTRALGAVLRAHRRYVLGQAIDGLFIPAIVFFPLLLGLLPDVAATLDMTALAGALAAAIGLAACLGAMRAEGSPRPLERIPLKAMLAASIPLWGVVLAQNIADWYGLATVAVRLGTGEAGLYRVSMQFASAFTIVSMSLFGVYSPQISAAHATGDWRKVALLARSATRLGTVLVLPPALLLLIAAPWALSFIGGEFVAASTTMRLAILGQMLFVALGSPGLVLAMVGHERTIFGISFTCMLAMLILAPLAAATLGTIGVVLTISALTVARNIAEFTALKRLTGVNGLTGRYVPPMRAA